MEFKSKYKFTTITLTERGRVNQRLLLQALGVIYQRLKRQIDGQPAKTTIFITC